MSHFRKPGVLLSLLAVTGAMLTSSQARGQFLLESARRKPAYAGSLDGGPEMTEMRERLYRRWRDDAEEAKRRHKKVKLVADPAKRKIQAPVEGGDPFVYFPTSIENDGKFLVLAGAQGTSTLSGSITIKLASPAGSPGLEVAVFDGDHGGLWDQGSAVTTYSLFEDGNANGVTDGAENPVAIETWSGSAMADNAWSRLTAGGTIGGANVVPGNYPNAGSANGNHFFRLVIQISSASSGALNCFKLRTTGSVRIIAQDSFNLIGAIATNTASIIYPNYPSLSPTTFDGAWDLFAFVPASIDYRNPLRPHSFDVWDGDLDYGSQVTPAEQDTDDPNTPNSVASLPVWAQSGGAVNEGVAVGYGGTTGNPPDDFSRAVFARSPSIRYDVTDPSGVRYVNSNPSGNSEWEMFRVETDPAIKNDPSVSDAAAPAAFLPAGIFQTHIEGMDLSNLNSFRFEYDVLGVDSQGNPVKPLLPYYLGDTVFSDTNLNGTQDVGEPGIGNVLVSLLDDNGNVIATTTTATTGTVGQYFFDVEPGDYTVRVEVSNFRAGGALLDRKSTTGGEFLSNTVTNANVLTYDFGYALSPSGSVGDYVWLDTDGDGVQDTNEPGIGGVTVTLSEGGSTLATTTTDLNGFYLFTGLDALTDHTYTVTVSGTVLTGLTQTYDKDGTGTALNSTLTLTAGTSNVLQDFGFVGAGSIGDLVWNELSPTPNTVFDPGVDVGLANVRVTLTWDYDGDGSVDMQYITTTDSEGYYVFSGLPPATAPGKYRVRVDSNSLPYGLQLVSDPDGTDTPSYSTLTLALGASNLAQDFGYAGAGTIGDTVWYDTDGDGVQNNGELGIPNVALKITGDTNRDNVVDYTATTTTDSNGLYYFKSLPGARYTVTVIQTALRDSWTRTYDLDGKDATPHTATASLAPRTSNLKFDFGYNGSASAPVSIGDFVWKDVNANGIQDSGELGLAGVTVNLLDSTGTTTLSTQVTGSSGRYLFSNLATGTYRIQFTNLPSGYALSPKDVVTGGGTDSNDSDADPTNSGKTAPITVTTPGQSDVTVDAGAYPAASVGDFVWNDANRDGIQNNGEAGISGVTVNLYTSGNVLVDTKTTGASGDYLFTGVIPGTYYLEFVLAGYTRTVQSAGLDTTVDSDANASTGKTANFTLAAGQSRTDIDAGGYQGSTLGDFIFWDKDSDGIFNNADTGLAGAVAKLYLSNDVLVATSPATDATGAYSFSGLAPGDYYVIFTLPNGYTFTTKDVGSDTTDSDANATTGKTGTYTLSAGLSNLTADCGAVVSTTGRIGDFVWLDRNGNGIQDATDSGLANITVDLYLVGNPTSQSTKVTDSAGAYAFTGLAAGSYYVKFTKPDSSYTISSKDVATGGATDLTDSDADPTTGQTDTIVLAAGENNSTIDAGMYQPASVGDTVWLDSNADGIQNYTDSNNNGRWDTGEVGEAGIAGVTVDLFTSGNVSAGSTTTDSQGHYSFTNVVAGDYYVKFTAAGYTFSPKDVGADDTHDSDADTTTGKTAVFTLSSGRNPIIWDAGVYLPAAVGNFIWEDFNASLPMSTNNQNGRQDASEPGLSGAQVKLFNADTGLQVQTTVTTSSSGSYSFTGLVPGSYYIEVTLPSGYLFSAKNASVATSSTDSDVSPTTGLTSTTDTFSLVSGQTNNDIDAGASLTPKGSIGDKVWIDTNRDGIQDVGETSTASGKKVTVSLAKLNDPAFVAPATQTIDLGTTYSFSGLDAGSYRVTFSALDSGYRFTAQNVAGATAATDSDVDPSTGVTGIIVLGRGESRTDIDAGVSLTATTGAIGNQVFYDANGNGIHEYTDANANGRWDTGEAGEPGIGSVTVTLYASTNLLTALATTTTDTSGVYSFGSRSAGSYVVKFTLPSSGDYATAKFTQADQGSSDNLDSDANASTGQTAAFTLGNGQTRNDIDCGLALTSSIGQLVWFDYNRDGIWQSATEQGLAGVTVTLTKGNSTTPFATTTTDANGLYLFSNLTPGSYTVTINASTISTAVIPANSLFRTYDYDGYATTPDVATYPLSAGEDVRFVNFGYSTAPKINTGVPYLTFTIGGWGSDPSTYVGNPGSRLHQWFSTVYPSGVQIGRHSGNAKYIAMWTSAQAVTNYLPAAGAANILANNYTTPAVGGTNNLGPNPVSLSQGGVLAAQLLGVQMDYDFSQAGATTGFRTGLGALYYKNTSNPTLHGMTVSAILSAANQYISADTNWQNQTYSTNGGAPSFTFPRNGTGGTAATATAANFVTALTDINQNFDNGTQDLGKLVVSPP